MPEMTVAEALAQEKWMHFFISAYPFGDGAPVADIAKARAIFMVLAAEVRRLQGQTCGTCAKSVDFCDILDAAIEYHDLLLRDRDMAGFGCRAWEGRP